MNTTLPPDQPTVLLGGLSPAQFLAEYWQKKPLLVRGALPGFTGTLSRDELFELARDPDMESRHIRHDGQHWSVQHGPIRASELRLKQRQPWTVLVQGVNLVDPDGDALLRQFNFIPHARLDDLMVSYAADGGGVGPHIDNYDVFLVQGMGKRRWRIGLQDDQRLVEDAPLRILKHFAPTEDWVLEPGDMLYLPPGWAHDGVAVGECMTYSVGFRTPVAQEVGGAFLGYLADRLCLEGVYADPDLQVPEHPGEIGAAMIERIAAMLSQIRWQREDVADFLGSYLTEPKPHVFFEPPEKLPSAKRFAKELAARGFRLDPRSKLLFVGESFYLNGELVDADDALRPYLIELADRRMLRPLDSPLPALIELLRAWQQDGFGELGATSA